MMKRAIKFRPLKSIFCKHKHTGWYVGVGTFYNLSGERRHEICEDCGKEISSYFHKYD